MGRFLYDDVAGRWLIVDADAVVRQELHCGDAVEVRPYDDDGAPWASVRIEMDARGMWYMVTEDSGERDDFELLDVRLDG